MKRRIIATLCLVSAFPLSSFGAPAPAPADFIHAKGRRLVVGPDNKEIVLRGLIFSNYVWDDLSVPRADHHDESDYARIKSWNANAERYKDETTIAGYELLNEPNVSKSKYQWIDLAKALVKEIRSVDAKHLIIVERLNAVANNWPDPGLDTGFFRVDDDNVLYTFHIYDPFEYTHQFTSWTYLANADGGAYPDASVVYAPSDALRSESFYGNPKAPSGDFAWRYFEGTTYRVADPATIAGKPVIHSERNSGEVFFDDLGISEYDENQKFLRTVASVNLNSDAFWYFWSENGKGSCGPVNTEGRGDGHSIRISGTTGVAVATGDRYCFDAVPGHFYSISGWMKGVKATGNSYFALDFVKSPSGGKTSHRDKDYLAHSLSHYLDWGIANDVLLYCGEYGCYYRCYEDGKGGARWLKDMVDLLQQAGISYTYHAYHDPTFGIFLDPGLPAEGRERKEVSEVLRNAWR